MKQNFLCGCSKKIYFESKKNMKVYKCVCGSIAGFYIEKYNKVSLIEMKKKLEKNHFGPNSNIQLYPNHILLNSFGNCSIIIIIHNHIINIIVFIIIINVSTSISLIISIIFPTTTTLF